MRTLLEKIEASAAQRLVLPPGRTPMQEIDRYKKFLKVESHRLQMQHHAGAGGRLICQARAALIDALLRHLAEAVARASPRPLQDYPVMGIVAIGGYGRGELNPCSDIDLMFLHEGELRPKDPHPYVSLVTEGLLFDLGLKPGHSVRSIAHCVQLANEDMQTKTSLLEARLITGTPGSLELFEQLDAHVLAQCVRGREDEYLAARLQDQAARHAKFGNSATMQEPNVKNGCGGLRDYQNLLWMAYFKYRTRTTADLVKQDLVSEREARQLEAAYDFLLRVRNELHYACRRSVDVLAKNLQPAIARHLGYAERSPRRRIEHFMGDYYTHSRNIYLITRTVEQRLALQPQQGRLPSIRALIRRHLSQSRQQLLDGFKFLDGEMQAATPRVFRDQPARLMRAFLYAQQRGLKLHPELAQLIRQALRLVDRAFLHDEHVRRTFLEILNQPGSVALVLRLMHDVGLLGKYLPEFGKLTALVQHEFYHQYTTDEHTLNCVEKLDGVWEGKEPPFCHYADLFRKVEQPSVLYLALLLHDSGKAQPGGDHTKASLRLAQRVARRLQLDPATASSLGVVIQHHLAMTQISQRRDLDDPQVVQDFARLVQTPENLALLTLHTLADSMGTSDQFWNGFKDALLLTLHQKAHEALTGHAGFGQAAEKQRQALQAEVAALLPRALAADEVQAHFESLPPRYFRVSAAKDVATDLGLAHRFMLLQLGEADRGLEPVLAWHNEPDRGYTSARVCTWDRPGLFAKIAGSFSAAGLNILSAQIFSRTDGIALDTFYVVDPASGAFVKKEEREKFEKVLRQALSVAPPDLRALIARQKPPRSAYQSLEGERIPTRVEFDNKTSANRTVIEIETEDRLGLLYVIAQVFAEMGLDISLAKIVTEKGAASDSFYVREPDGQKVTSPERQKAIEARVREGIESVVSGQ